jgi:uncharacterized protein YaiI (UPF0178 family)
MLQSSINVWVDADACPVKTEIVRVCKRHGIVPRLVSNKSLALFTDRQDVTVLTVTGDFDTAENCIVENLLPGDLVLTDEVPLASRVLMEGGAALDFLGRWFTEDNMDKRTVGRRQGDLRRRAKILKGGPEKPVRADRSRLLRELDAFLSLATKEANSQSDFKKN